MRILAALALAVLAFAAGAASRPHLQEAVPVSVIVDASQVQTNAPAGRIVKPIDPVPMAERIQAVVTASVQVDEAALAEALADAYRTAGFAEFATAVSKVVVRVTQEQACSLVVAAIRTLPESERLSFIAYVFQHVDLSTAEQLIVSVIHRVDNEHAVEMIVSAICARHESERQTFVAFVFQHIDPAQYERMVAAAVAAVSESERAATIAAIVQALPCARIVHAVVQAMSTIDPERADASTVVSAMIAVAEAVRSLPPESRTPEARAAVQVKSPEWYALRLYDGGTALWAIATKAKWYAEHGDTEKVAELYRFFVKMMIKVETSQE